MRQGNLIMLRKENRYSQEEIAQVLGISLATYGQKERGERDFKLEEMFKLSDFFDLPMEKIFLSRKSLYKQLGDAIKRSEV